MEEQKKEIKQQIRDIKDAYREAIELQKQYIYLSEPREHDILMLWNMHTWMYKYFGVTPYIKLSGMKGSGKTAIMEFALNFIDKGVMTSDLSKPAIFRLIKKGYEVLLLDEFENMSKRDSKRMESVLNGGYKNSGKAARCSGDKFEPEEFIEFCPKMFATMKGIKSETLNDRCIEIVTVRTLEKMKQTYLEQEDRQRMAVLKAEMREWILAKKEGIVENFKEFSDIVGRDYELLGPLLSIAKTIGLDADAIKEYCLLQKQEQEEYLLEDDWGYKLLVTLNNMTSNEKVKYTVKKITEKYRDVMKIPGIKERKTGVELRQLGFRPQPRTGKGVSYILSNEDVKKTIKEYGYSEYFEIGREESTPNTQSTSEPNPLGTAV